MSKIKVVDDFLSPFEFEPIRNKIESKDFPWYWQSHSHGNIINHLSFNMLFECR